MIQFDVIVLILIFQLLENTYIYRFNHTLHYFGHFRIMTDTVSQKSH